MFRPASSPSLSAITNTCLICSLAVIPWNFQPSSLAGMPCLDNILVECSALCLFLILIMFIHYYSPDLPVVMDDQCGKQEEKEIIFLMEGRPVG